LAADGGDLLHVDVIGRVSSAVLSSDFCDCDFLRFLKSSMVST
jgi:hypothetical protein